MLRRALLITTIAGCWSAARPPARVREAPFPGALWITPRQPWRVTERPTAVLVDGATAILGGSEGWLARFDLVRGQLVREASLGPLTVGDVDALPQNRLLVVGTREGLTVGFVVDATTFAATPLALGATQVEQTYLRASAVAVPTGIAIAGPGLPLAIYDRDTLARRDTLDAELSWDGLIVAKGALYGQRMFKTYRFDLATREKHAVPGAVVAAAGDAVVTRVYVAGKPQHELTRGAGPPIKLPRLGLKIGIDARGTRLASLVGTVVTVVSVAEGKVTGTYDLAPVRALPSQLVFDGERLVITVDSIVRVIDLRSGAVTPAGAPPFGSYARLAVGDDGAVVALGAELWRVIDGAITSGVRLGKHPTLTAMPGELRRFGAYTSRSVDDTVEPRVSVASLDPREPPRAWALERHADGGWLGKDGEVAVTLGWEVDSAPKLLRSKGKELDEVFAFNLDTIVDDVDVDGKVAAVTIKGVTHIVDLRDGSVRAQLAIPACAEYGLAYLERGGGRVVTYNDKDVMLYRRTKNDPIATVRLARDVFQPTFVPTTDELLLQYEGGFALWSPKARTLSSIAIPHLGLVEVSANGALLAISLHDGRLALVDFATLRAAMRAEPLVTVPPLEEACPEHDPFQLDGEHQHEEAGDGLDEGD